MAKTIACFFCEHVYNGLAVSIVFQLHICNLMGVLSFINKAFFNRYVLALAAFVTWILFFDKNDFYTQRQRKTELEELNTKIDYYKQQIGLTQQQLDALENDPGTLEKYAREKYFMKRDNEDVFVIRQAALASDSITTNK